MEVCLRSVETFLILVEIELVLVRRGAGEGGWPQGDWATTRRGHPGANRRPYDRQSSCLDLQVTTRPNCLQALQHTHSVIEPFAPVNSWGTVNELIRAYTSGLCLRNWARPGELWGRSASAICWIKRRRLRTSWSGTTSSSTAAFLCVCVCSMRVTPSATGSKYWCQTCRWIWERNGCFSSRVVRHFVFYWGSVLSKCGFEMA